MKRTLFAVVAAAILVAFTAPSFAGEDKKKDEKKGGHFSQVSTFFRSLKLARESGGRREPIFCLMPSLRLRAFLLH